LETTSEVFQGFLTADDQQPMAQSEHVTIPEQESEVYFQLKRISLYKWLFMVHVLMKQKGQKRMEEKSWT